MYCRKCGRLNDDNFYKCLGCGEILPHDDAPLLEKPMSLPVAAATTGGKVPDHTQFAVLSAVLPLFFCCCFGLAGSPLSIVAYIFASKAKKLNIAGDVSGSLKASKTALILCWSAVALSFFAAFAFLMVYMKAIIELAKKVQEGGYGT